jgi:hypothetical protein
MKTAEFATKTPPKSFINVATLNRRQKKKKLKPPSRLLFTLPGQRKETARPNCHQTSNQTDRFPHAVKEFAIVEANNIRPTNSKPICMLSSRTRSTLSYLHYLGARVSTRSVSLRGFALGVFFNRILASTWCGEKHQNRRRKHVRALLVFLFCF